MAKVFEADLSLAGMRKLKKELTHYRNAIMKECLRAMLDDLTDLGIRVAYENVGSPFTGHIKFTKEFLDAKYNFRPYIMMYGIDLKDFVAVWYRGQEKIEKDVNSLLMAEFGSGQHTEDNTGQYIIHKSWQGTFPDQTHAFDSDGWYWAEEPFTDPSKVEWKHSTGYRPTMPMWNAYKEMKEQVLNIAKHSFERISL